MNIGYTWTDERIDVLKRTWGLQSASEIAERIGMSRNAVCGKAWRLGLGSNGAPVYTDFRLRAAKPKPTSPKPAPRTNNPFGGAGIRKARKRPAKPTQQRVRIHTGGGRAFRGEVEIKQEPILVDLPPDQSEFACTIHELTDSKCRFVLGSATHDALYCGTPCTGSWCGRHGMLVFTKPEKRER